MKLRESALPLGISGTAHLEATSLSNVFLESEILFKKLGEQSAARSELIALVSKNLKINQRWATCTDEQRLPSKDISFFEHRRVG